MPKSPGNDPIAAEIQAEIADHLATAAEKLQSQGLPTAEAQEKSKAQFGDADLITRRCYWIKQGDALMFRTAIIVLLTLLCVTLGLVAYSGYYSQRQMAEQMTALAEQLRHLAEQQQTVPPTPTPPAEPKPLSISGRVFDSSPDKPCVNNEVLVCRANDGEIVRRVTTQAEGEFHSGPLIAGDYTLVIKGVTPTGATGTLGLQTAPIFLYSGQLQPEVNIDLRYRSGDLKIKLSGPLPEWKEPGKYVIASRLYLVARPTTAAMRNTRWKTELPSPQYWPVLVRYAETTSSMNPDRGGPGSSPTFAVLSTADLQKNEAIQFAGDVNPLPAGPSTITATIVADVAPDAEFDLDEMMNGGMSERFQKHWSWMSDEWVREAGMGGIWHTILAYNEATRRAGERGFVGENAGAVRIRASRSNLLANSFSRGNVTTKSQPAQVVIGDQEATTIEIEVPPDMLSRIKTLVEEVTDPSKFKQAVDADQPFVRSAKITVLGTTPLAPTSAE